MKRLPLDALETALRAEARQIRGKDGFSPLLHQRLMQALRTQGLPTDASETPRRPWAFRLALPLGLAAAVALGAWLILHTSDHPPTPAPQIVILPVPEIPQNPITVSRQATALDERKYAYLDRDAHRLLIFVADQLPNLPEPK